MTKGKSIVLRVSTENKQAIKSAADSANKSLTTFITEAALKQAGQVARRPPSRGVHGGLPSWFQATCYEAAKGGARGYETAGWKLAAALCGEMPYDVEDDEWATEVEKLKHLLDRDDDPAVIAWFKQHYPRCMALIPLRRRKPFIAGVVRAYQDGEIEF